MTTDHVRLHPGSGLVAAGADVVIVVAPGLRSTAEVAGQLGPGLLGDLDDAAIEALLANGVEGVGRARRRADGRWELCRWGTVRVVATGHDAAGLAAEDGYGVSVAGEWMLAVDATSSAALDGTWLAAGLVPAGGVSRVGAVPPDGSPPGGTAAHELAATSPSAPPSAPTPSPAPATPPPSAPIPAPPPAPGPTPAAPPAPVNPPPPPGGGSATSFIDLTARPGQREPLPRLVIDTSGVQVRGLHCRNAHFNNPASRLCYLCGDNMQNQSIAIGPSGEIGILGTRPPLGIVTLDDGTTYQLSGDLVIGRDPSTDDHLAAVVNDASVSRNHLRIHLEDWKVLVEDLGSVNGSQVLLPGATVYQRLQPEQLVPVESGTVISFGRRWASFEATAAAG